MMSAVEAALRNLQRVDARIAAGVASRKSLDPARALAHPLAAIAQAVLVRHSIAERTVAAFAGVLARIAEAQLRAFPDTIFWDFDLLAQHLLTGARPQEAGAEERLHVTGELVVRLHERFGAEPIHFRYAHDFVYGFDWARWVSKEPEARACIGPFDGVFLQALLDRGAEIIELIERDDEKYPKLAAGAPRNAFGFSREPEHEATLFEELARSGSVPVEAWRLDAEPCWDRPFHEIRETRARALGIPAGLIGSRDGRP